MPTVFPEERFSLFVPVELRILFSLWLYFLILFLVSQIKIEIKFEEESKMIMINWLILN